MYNWQIKLTVRDREISECIKTAVGIRLKHWQVTHPFPLSIIRSTWDKLQSDPLGQNTVTVNSQVAYEKGEYFLKELAVANSSAPQSAQIDVVATQQGNNATDSGRLLVPKATQDFTYDLDGNLTFDGIWQYEWDAENRLKAIRRFVVCRRSKWLAQKRIGRIEADFRALPESLGNHARGQPLC